MKRPDGIDLLSLAEDAVGAGGAYPPLGFKPIWEADLGNGDYYGLYWPYGREDRDPVICDMLHDQWGLQLAFSSVPVFLRYLELNEGCRGDHEVDDPSLPSTRFQSVRAMLHDQPEDAASHLESICADFPECADYWFALAGQLRRLGDSEGCARAAIRAFSSNWAFGMPPNGTLKLLQNANANSIMPNDPLVARSSEIQLKFGGSKENSVYGVLKDCIGRYLASDNPLPGILLNQNYGYMMLMETTAFQDRYGFRVDCWLDEHSQMCLDYLGDDRREIG